jgi:hypothetical protein
MEKEYEPYGKDWERQIMRLNKKEIVDLLRKVSRDRGRINFKMFRILYPHFLTTRADK